MAHAAAGANAVTRIVACLDARMREVYVALVERREGAWTEIEPPRVVGPDALLPPPGDGWLGAGNGFGAYPDLAERLGMGHEGNVTRAIRRVNEYTAWKSRPANLEAILVRRD